MTISPELLSLVKAQEGCRLAPYLDVAGVPTIGYGHTGSVKMDGPPITQGQAEELLAADLAHFQSGVRAQCPDVSDGARLDALTDFAFNVGLAALAGSTLRKKVLVGDWLNAATACKQWNKAHVRGELVEVPALTKRRAIEAGWLASGVYEP